MSGVSLFDETYEVYSGSALGGSVAVESRMRRFADCHAEAYAALRLLRVDGRLPIVIGVLLVATMWGSGLACSSSNASVDSNGEVTTSTAAADDTDSTSDTPEEPSTSRPETTDAMSSTSDIAPDIDTPTDIPIDPDLQTLIDQLPPTVTVDEGTPPLVEIDQSGARRAYEEARRLHDTGEHVRSLRLIEETLRRPEHRSFFGRLRALRVEVRRDYLNRHCLEGSVRFDADRYTVGDVIEAELVLRNVSPYPVTIHADSPLEGDPTNARTRTIFRTEVTYSEFRPNGSIYTDRATRNFILDETVSLEPGEAHRIRAVINTGRLNPAGLMYRTYSMGGLVYAPSVEVGQEMFNGPLDLKSKTGGVFPRRAEHLAGRPLARMQEALRKRQPLHLTLASAYLAEGEIPAAYRWIDAELGRLGPDDALVPGLLTCLMILSGERLPIRWEVWKEWLEKRI